MASVIVERSSVLPALLPGSSHTTIGNTAWIKLYTQTTQNV